MVVSDTLAGSVLTALTIIVVSLIQRSRDIRLAREQKGRDTAVKEVLDSTHDAVNSNWKAATAEIRELKRLMQAAGVQLPPEL